MILKQTTFFASIFALLMITGCAGGFSSFSKGKQSIDTYNFQTGSDGVVMQFIEGLPPKQMFIGTDFSTGIKVKNNGAYDVTQNAEIKIIVPDQSAFRFTEGNNQNTKEFKLKGRSLYLKEGDEDVIMFPMKSLCFPGYDGTKKSIVTNYTRKIKATSCYYYETNANVDVCIDSTKFLGQQIDKPVCQMKEIVFSGGQGGPVGITRLSPTIIPKSKDKMTLQLAISVNKLKGQDYLIFGPGNKCDINSQNEVSIEVQIGGTQMICKPQKIKLKEKESVSSICTKEIDAQSGIFLSPAVINMKYYVQQSLLQQITVEPVPGGTDCGALSGKGSTTSDQCSQNYPDYSCQTVSCAAGEDIDSCAERFGCIRGLCPGGQTNICCPG